MTWDGWALLSEKRCFHYGYRKLHEIISYRPIGKTIQGMEAFQVTAKTGVSDVELWVKQPNITDAFPDIVTELSGKTFKVIVLKKDDAWYATLNNGNPAQGVASAPKWRSVPKLRELLAVEERMFFGTIGEGTVCTVLPMLGAAKTDTPLLKHTVFPNH